jgi:hypothetical protein
MTIWRSAEAFGDTARAPTNLTDHFLSRYLGSPTDEPLRGISATSGGNVEGTKP